MLLPLFLKQPSVFKQGLRPAWLTAVDLASRQFWLIQSGFVFGKLETVWVTICYNIYLFTTLPMPGSLKQATANPPSLWPWFWTQLVPPPANEQQRTQGESQPKSIWYEKGFQCMINPCLHSFTFLQTRFLKSQKHQLEKRKDERPVGMGFCANACPL